VKSRTLLRLLLKLAGVLLVGLYIEHAIRDAIMYAQMNIYGNAWFANSLAASKFDQLLIAAYQLLTSFAPLIVALYLIFGGQWLVNKLLPLHRPFCSNCGHQFRNSNVEKCPECGASRVIHTE